MCFKRCGRRRESTRAEWQCALFEVRKIGGVDQETEVGVRDELWLELEVVAVERAVVYECR